MVVLCVLALTACGGSSSPLVLPVTAQFPAPVEAAGEGHIYYPGVAYDDQPEALIGDHLTDPQYLAILCFDITGIDQMTSAVLTFHRSGAIGNPWALGPLMIDHFIGDGVLDQSHKALNTIGAAFHEFDTDAPSFRMDVTQQVARDRADGRNFSSFRVRFDLPSSSNGQADQLLIGTSKNADAALHPVLVITEPLN